MSSLVDLPAELVLQILSFLTERQPHSIKNLHGEPSETLLQSEYQPVKNLSLTCRRLRTLCLQTLFTNVKLTSTSLGLSVFREQFISFFQDHDLVRGIESVLFYQVASDNRDNEHEYRKVPLCTIEWQILWTISQLNPPAITIMLHPSSFQELMPYDLRESDDWAFQIPYQVLHLSQATDTPSACVPVDKSQDKNILNILPWSHCTFNEGSSIRAYSTYQYFQKHVPSIFTPINEQKMRDGVRRTLPYLTSIDYIAIFPFPARHMQHFCSFLKVAAPSLRHLRTRFSPTRGNGALDDKETLGTCERTDLWSELETCYTFLGLSLRLGILDSLDDLTVLDYDNPELRDAIYRALAFEMCADWAHDGNGKWVVLTGKDWSAPRAI
ncbi:hypothetical protein JMJ35_010492 [Cladonia borealis]|uniref:F-box domain-containing protein n=1 Tax=Cladonia borealis TaxID=184061 RepID=A0AA39QSF7_9LECA|nr:hypothetical protein JMJ35_010492 [Cladonia borealis]